MNSQTKTTVMTPHVDVKRLHDLLDQQKVAYQRHPVPSAKERIERLARLKNILVKYQDQFANAINQDYGNRAVMETKIGEVLTCLEHIKYYSKNLTEWMKPSKRVTPTSKRLGRISTIGRDRCYCAMELSIIAFSWSFDLCIGSG